MGGCIFLGGHAINLNHNCPLGLAVKKNWGVGQIRMGVGRVWDGLGWIRLGVGPIRLGAFIHFLCSLLFF